MINKGKFLNLKVTALKSRAKLQENKLRKEDISYKKEISIYKNKPIPKIKK
jgi:hypothetical protein